MNEGPGNAPAVMQDVQRQHGQHLESAGPSGSSKAAVLPGPEERV